MAEGPTFEEYISSMYSQVNEQGKRLLQCYEWAHSTHEKFTQNLSKSTDKDERLQMTMNQLELQQYQTQEMLMMMWMTLNNMAATTAQMAMMQKAGFDQLSDHI